MLSWFKSIGKKPKPEEGDLLEKFGLPFDDEDVEYYCRYEWLPSVITTLKDGSKDAFSLTEKGWIRQSPGELSMKAGLISRDDFYGWLQGYGHVYEKAEGRKRFLEESARIRAEQTEKVNSQTMPRPFKDSDVESYTVWERDPAVIVSTPDGSKSAFFLTGSGEWRECLVADVANKGGLVSKADFHLLVASIEASP